MKKRGLRQTSSIHVGEYGLTFKQKARKATMTNKNTITVQLIVNDDGSVVMKQFGKNAEEAMNKAGSSATKASSTFQSLKGTYLDFMAKATSAYLAARKAMEYMTQGAQAEQVTSSFRIMAESANANAGKMISVMRAATKETIDDSDMMQKAIKMMTLGFNPAQIERFSKVVITASQVAGTTAGEAYERLADAISTRMPRSLIQMGAVTRDQMKIVQAAIDAGADSTYLYELAVANLELKQKQLQGTQDASTIGIQKFKAQAKEAAEVVGQLLIVGLQKLWAMFQYIEAGSLYASGGIYKLVQAFDVLMSHMPGTDKAAWQKSAEYWKEMATGDFAAAQKIAQQATDNLIGRVEVEKRATNQELADAKARVDAKLAEGVAIAEKAKADTKAQQAAIKAAEDARRLREEWDKTAIKINQAIELDGLTGLSRELKENEQAAENLKKQFEKLDPATRDAAYAIIEKAKATADATARLNEEIQAEQDYLNIIKEEAAERDKLIEYYSQIEGYEQKAYELKLARIGEERKAYITMYGDVAAANAKASQDQIEALSDKIDAEQKGARSIIANYSSIIDAAMKCYDEDSEEYKRLQDFKKVALAAELAMEISKNAQIIAGYFTQSAAAVAAAGVQNAANASTAVTGAVSSIAAQGTVPVAGFGLVAAMMAVMAGVLGIAGLTLGGGSSTAAASVSSLPKSTVLGAENGTGSESIANSLEILTDTYDMENIKLTKIYEEVRSLNTNITGLVTSIVRTGGISTDTMGIITGDSINGISGINSTFNSNTSDILNYSLDPMKQINSYLFGKYDILGKLEDALFGFANSAVNWISNGLFGGDTETSIAGGGIAFGANKINDILSGKLNAQQYALIKTVTSGGWFEGDDTSVSYQYAALNSNVTRMLSLVYKGLGSTLVTLSEELGTDVNAALNYVFESSTLNLQGMSTDEMNTAIQEYISNISDTAVEAIFGDAISQYQKLNEGLLETAIRLISDKETIAKILELTNQTFSGTTSQFIKFSESLITVAGSLDKLTDAFSTYYEAFTSDDKKQADRQAALQDALSSYGYSLPTKREGYSGLVETPGISQQAYYALLALSDTADKYYDYLEAAEKNATSSIDPSDYATKVDYLRALAQASNGGNIPAFAAGTDYFGGGYAWVGEAGRELAYFDSPARIYSNKDTVKMTNNNDLISEMRALRASSESDKIEIITKIDTSNRYLQFLEKWDEDGLPAETVL
ncbi:MAG: hypothetical protein WC374_10070 [Phycisphaerae bacterium]